MGYSYPMGNYPPRRTLSAPVAAALTDAHQRTGWSYRRVASVLGITHAYWWRLCRGDRAPSRRVAFTIIEKFRFDGDVAEMLLAESVEKP